nr:Syg1 [Starmerella bombicola]
MHFAQTFDASVVPEWKSRYINYAQGKKAIAKLEKSIDSQLGNWQLPPPAQDLPNERETVTHVGYPPRNSTMNTARNQLQSGTASPLEPLPRARLHQANPEFVSARTGRQLRRTPVRPNERSPLIDTPFTSLYATPQDYTESSSGSIGMQPINGSDSRTSARKQFFAWVNGEVTKVNRFYESMENECSAKIQLLETQLEHFQQHRALHHQERNSKVPKSAFTFLENLDLPSLPAVFHRDNSPRENAGFLHPPNSFHRRRQAAHTSDFNNHDDHVGYYQAKGMLKVAVSDLYQSLLQLRGFRQLNDTAVRKIVKKFDKQLHFNTLDKYLDETKPLAFRASENLEEMIRRCENMYTTNFTKGNHKLAVESLNIQALNDRESFDMSVLITGIALGASVPLIILALYAALHSMVPHHEMEARYLLQMYGAFLIVGIILLGFGFAMAVWSHFRINYPFIIELDRPSMLDYREYPVLPSLYIFFLALCGWLTFNTVQAMHRYYVCIFLGLFGVALLTPFGPYWDARRWLLHSLWRLVFSGLYSVEFRDLLMGDVLCSLAYPLSTMELFFCVFSTPNWWNDKGANHAQRCTSSRSRALGFLECLPGIWRFLQCWRRYADTLDWFPHLLNAGKYSFTILYYMSLSLARISPHDSGLKAMFIVFALINGLYTASWDVLMDFSLSPAWEPRSVTVFPRWAYFFIMIADPIMRQNWVLYAIFWDKKEEGAFISFIVALIEALRRIMWVIFRVENEHAANISRCRAFKNLNLPYDENSIKPPPQTHDAEHTPSRSQTFPSPASQSMPRQSSRRTSITLSPRIEMAHINDFQRRKPKASE